MNKVGFFVYEAIIDTILSLFRKFNGLKLWQMLNWRGNIYTTEQQIFVLYVREAVT